MRVPTDRRLLWLLGVLAIAVPTIMILTGEDAAADTALEAVVTRGDFAVTVTTSGELQALSAVEITAPEKAQEAGAFQMKIAEIVPEGTVVQPGDKVAELEIGRAHV